VALPLPLPVGDGEDVALGVALGVAVPLPLSEGVAVPLPLGEGVAVPLPLPLRLGVALGEGLGEALSGVKLSTRTRPLRISDTKSTVTPLLASSASPKGPAKLALAAAPSTIGHALPMPASVLTASEPAAITRIWLLPWSVKKIAPAASQAGAPSMPSSAAVPTPLAFPTAPAVLPASVPVAPETTFTLRTRPKGLPSTTTSTPLARQNTELPGLENSEAVPPTSPHPIAPLPARVLTSTLPPLVATARTLCPAQSLTYTVPPSGDTASPAGDEKVAMEPMPLAAPEPPEPASVVTAPPFGAIARTAWLATSATYTTPLTGFTAVATGELSRAVPALPPAPLTKPVE
jgi:hypothetical protein